MSRKATQCILSIIICAHAHKHTLTNTWTRAHTHWRTHQQIHTHSNTHRNKQTHNTHARTRTHTHTHTHTHIHTDWPDFSASNNLQSQTDLLGLKRLLYSTSELTLQRHTIHPEACHEVRMAYAFQCPCQWEGLICSKQLNYQPLNDTNMSNGFDRDQRSINCLYALAGLKHFLSS